MAILFPSVTFLKMILFHFVHFPKNIESLLTTKSSRTSFLKPSNPSKKCPLGLYVRHFLRATDFTRLAGSQDQNFVALQDLWIVTEACSFFVCTLFSHNSTFDSKNTCPKKSQKKQKKPFPRWQKSKSTMTHFGFVATAPYIVCFRLRIVFTGSFCYQISVSVLWVCYG